MRIIDTHAHAFPDAIAARAVAKLESMGDCKANGNGTVADLIAHMDAAGVDRAVLCTIATKPDQFQGILDWCESIRCDRIEPLASVHPDDPALGPHLEEIARRGLKGIKLHPHYQEFLIDEPRMDAVYSAVAGNGLVLSCHCGRDFNFSDDDDRASPQRLARMLDRHGDLRFLATHLGGYHWWDEVERVLLGRPIHMETSFALVSLGPQKSAELIRRHGTDGVMFGTDWPWRPTAEEVALLNALPLSDAELDAVRYGNAARLLGLD